ncbi:MAG: M23 family metallopeptidase [Chloroflexi bacterium]|nr:MAG: M23 family metallopeptidase [Chloroflexota bacterium]TMD53629.1 MAG: M23 family metallopeptidase [Chloroflexota bacterium]
MNVLLLGALAVASLVFFLLLGQRPPAAAGEVVPGAVVSQPFGCTTLELEPPDPACPSGHFHSGLDLAAPTGTPVLAPAGGVVVGAGEAGSCGIHVLLDHGGGVATLYCHLAQALVGPGQPVFAGEQLGRVGATGLATGPHLHFEVHLEGRPVDPAAWLRQLPVNPNQLGGK